MSSAPPEDPSTAVKPDGPAMASETDPGQPLGDAVPERPDLPDDRPARRRTFVIWGLILAFGAAFVVVAVITIGGASSDELFRDDFDGPKNFWTGEDAKVSETYQHGGYEIMVKDPSVPQSSRSWFDEGQQQALTFAADAVIVRGPRASMGIGVGCFQDKDTGYVMLVGPAGDFAVSNATDILRQGQGPPLLGNGQTNRLAITCDGSGDQTVLQLSVNGEKVVRFTDADGLDSFGGIGFTVATSEPGTLVRFDNALAEGI